MIPQIIWIFLTGLGLLLSAHLHGKESSAKHNFFTILVLRIIMFVILYAGGFFMPLFGGN